MARVPDRVVDALISLVLIAIGLLGTGPASQDQPGGVEPDPLAYGLVIAAALIVAARRVWPVATLAAVALVTSTYLVIGYAFGPIIIPFVVAVYSVAVQLPLRPALVASAAALVVMLAHVFTGGADLTGIAPGAAIVAAPFAIGATIRLGREAAAREHDERAREAAFDERLRVAQEVHDVVGHGLAAINMQAEIALHLLPKRPEQAEAALSAISRTSRQALDELRSTLTVVRSRDGDSRAPGPGLARLDALLARMADTGVAVRLETVGARRDLTSAVDLAAYRVVQESLTNVLRHAGAASATVRLAFAADELSIEVTDDGRGPAEDFAPGHGIAGMRERVLALGGVFEAGERPGGGFRVCARLPIAAGGTA